MSKVYTVKGKLWELLNSWWILLTFLPLGITSFLAFLYIGFKVKKRRWIIFGFAYLIIMFFLFKSPPMIMDLLLALVWIISIIHVFKIRPVYLIYLDVLISHQKSFEQKITELRQEAERDINIRENRKLQELELLEKSTKDNERSIASIIKETDKNLSIEKNEKSHEPIDKNIKNNKSSIASNIKETEKNLIREREETQSQIENHIDNKFSIWETGLILSRSERNLRNEIRNQIFANPNSLNYINKVFKDTGSIKHSLLKSFKEKILLEIRTYKDFNKYKDVDIEVYIEDETKRILKKFY